MAEDLSVDKIFVFFISADPVGMPGANKTVEVRDRLQLYLVAIGR